MGYVETYLPKSRATEGARTARAHMQTLEWPWANPWKAMCQRLARPCRENVSRHCKTKDRVCLLMNSEVCGVAREPQDPN